MLVSTKAKRALYAYLTLEIELKLVESWVHHEFCAYHGFIEWLGPVILPINLNPSQGNYIMPGVRFEP